MGAGAAAGPAHHGAQQVAEEPGEAEAFGLSWYVIILTIVVVGYSR